MYLTAPKTKNFFNIMDELFETTPEIVKERTVTPNSNVIKSDDGYKIELLLPGFNKKDINLKIDDNILTISAKREVELTENEKYLKKEFSYTKLERSFSLNDEIDVNKVDAKMVDGILNVTLPLNKEKKSLIDIKVK